MAMFETPVVRDYGSITSHTFNRCETGTPEPGAPPKDFRDFPLDNFGECSEGHIS